MWRSIYSTALHIIARSYLVNIYPCEEILILDLKYKEVYIALIYILLLGANLAYSYKITSNYSIPKPPSLHTDILLCLSICLFVCLAVMWTDKCIKERGID